MAEYTIYEFFEGNNTPGSKLRRIGNFEKEQEIRSEMGSAFFELYYSLEDVGEIATKRELDKVNKED